MKTIMTLVVLSAAFLTFGQPFVSAKYGPASESGVVTAASEAIQPLLDLLGGKGTIVTTLLAWVAALGMALAPVSTWISHSLRDSLNRVAASQAEDDDAYLRRLFSAKWYSAAAFLLRFISVDLPVLADLERAIKLQAEAVEESKTTNPS